MKNMLCRYMTCIRMWFPLLNRIFAVGRLYPEEEEGNPRGHYAVTVVDSGIILGYVVDTSQAMFKARR